MIMCSVPSGRKPSLSWFKLKNMVQVTKESSSASSSRLMWTSNDISRIQLSAGLLCVGYIWGSAWRPTAPSGSLCQKIQSNSRKKLLPGWHKENTWVQIGVSYWLVNSAPDEWTGSISFLGACDPLGLNSVPQLAHGLRVKRNGNPKASWGNFTQKLCGYCTEKSTNVHCYIQAPENNGFTFFTCLLTFLCVTRTVFINLVF